MGAPHTGWRCIKIYNNLYFISFVFIKVSFKFNVIEYFLFIIRPKRTKIKTTSLLPLDVERSEKASHSQECISDQDILYIT